MKWMQRRDARRQLLALVLVVLQGCDVNQTGDLAAEKLGDVSGQAERGDPRAALATTCAALEKQGAASGGQLRRRPYLQRLTDRSVRVLWTATPDASPPSVVVADDQGRTVTQVDPSADGSVTTADGSLQWTAEVAGLAPDTTYCYELRGAGQPWMRAAFRTAPSEGAARSGRPVRFVAFGDSGSGHPDQRALLAQMQTVPFDLLIHVGDLAYDHGTRREIEDNVFGVYGELFDTFAFFPASGNHEYDTEDALPFREAFDLPENGGPAGRERWYSFDYGDVHFVALDTERSGAEQAAWLDADLKANRRPWTIVYMHRPPFSSGQHGSDPAARRFFMPLFEKHRVPLVLAGHDHHYERIKPQNGVAYVVTGGGGKGTRLAGESAFTAFSEQVIHFVYVVVNDDTLTMHAIDGRGTEFDSLVVHRP